MSGGGLIRLLAQRLAGGAAKEAETPVLREVLARRLGRASDGSILPVREPEPFSNSLRGSNNDLMDAAGMSPSRPLPDAGSVQGGNATLYRGSNTGGRRGRWMTPDRQAAGDYGQVSSASQDVRGALEISDFGDLEVALGDKAAVLRRMDADNADVWDALEEPSVQAALRENGHRVVRLSDDVSPTGRRHESYLFLDESRAETGPTTARDGSGGGQGGQRVWHVTPHEFTPEEGYPVGRFRTDLPGTGESNGGGVGALAYGPGGYVTSSPKVRDGFYEQFMRSHGRANIYEAEIPPDGYVDWDEPFGKQPRNIQEALRENYGGDRIDPSAQARVIGTEEANKLRARGIPGVQYRGGLRDGDHRNFAVFNGDDIRLLRRVDPSEIGIGQNPARPLPDGGPLQRALRDRMQRE